MDGLAFEFFKVGGAGVGQHQVADVDVGAHARMGAIVHEADHFVYVIQQAEPEWLEFERDVDFLFGAVVAEFAAGRDGPLPLRRGGDDFTLPEVFTQHEQDILRAPIAGQIDEPFAAFEMKAADRFVEVNQPDRHDRQRNDRQPPLLRRASDEADFPIGDADRRRENVHRVETDAGDVLKPRGRVDAGLLEGAVDEAQFHAGLLNAIRKMNRISSPPASRFAARRAAAGTRTKYPTSAAALKAG